MNQALKDQFIHVLTGAILLGRVENAPPTDLDEWLLDFMALRSMDLETATEILGYFPAPFFFEDPKNDELRLAIRLVQDFYQGVSSWLVYRRKKINTNQLKESRWKEYKDFAVLSEQRLRLISQIFKIDQKFQHQSIFGSEYLLWLMAEAAVCRQVLDISGIVKPKFVKARFSKEEYYSSSKEAHYKRIQDSISQLWIPGEEITTRPINSLEEFFYSLDEAIDLRGYELAEDQNFYDEYYRPYLQARKRWNVACRNTKNLQLFTLYEPAKLRKPNPENMGKARKRQKM